MSEVPSCPEDSGHLLTPSPLYDRDKFLNGIIQDSLGALRSAGEEVTSTLIIAI